jgi:farnesyl-diphosphate farnesyltransferase
MNQPTKQSHIDIMETLEATSRTFYIPISRMPPGLKEATTSAYLCMRAIDEVEDHTTLTNTDKVKLLGQISLAFQKHSYEEGAEIHEALETVFNPYRRRLPAVSLNLGAWASHAPSEIAPRIWADTAAMAERMAYWASVNWKIHSREDLDAYSYSTAAAVGLLICDILAWHTGAQMSRNHAIYFGRGLQITNIARNRAEDIERGVDFYPPGWNDADIRDYAAHWLGLARQYADTLPEASSYNFIMIPLALAEATLEALASGQPKLTREAVLAIVNT